MRASRQRPTKLWQRRDQFLYSRTTVTGWASAGLYVRFPVRFGMVSFWFTVCQNGPKMGPKTPGMTKVPKSPDAPPPKSQPPTGKGKNFPPKSQPPAGKGKDSGKGKAYALEDYQYIKKDGLKKSKKDGKYDIPEEQDIPVLPRPKSNDSDIKEKIDEDQTEGAIEDNDAMDSNNDNDVTDSEGEPSGY